MKSSTKQIMCDEMRWISMDSMTHVNGKSKSREERKREEENHITSHSVINNNNKNDGRTTIASNSEYNDRKGRKAAGGMHTN